MEKRRRFLQRGGLLPAAAIVTGAAAPVKTEWKTALALSASRKPVSGSAQTLSNAIRRAADLRIATAFHHNEHIDTSSRSPELIQEVAEFRTTYLLDDRWTAAFMTLRQPISLPDSFGPRPSMSFFLYNQDGSQAVARPHLDGQLATGEPGTSPVTPDPTMPKYHQFDSWDGATNAPSQNFTFDFDEYRFLVRDDWEEKLHHTASGKVISGSVRALASEFRSGREVKVAIRNLCADLGERSKPVEHEVFVQTGSCYYYTEQDLFIAGTHPLVRVKPGVPLKYRSKGWDFGWLMVRTDGLVNRWLVDPYTLKFHKSADHCAIRWFVR